MFFRQFNSEFVQHVSCVALQRAKQAAITVHNNETEFGVVGQQGLKRFRVKLVVTQIQRSVDRFEGLKVNVDLLLLVVIGHNRATIYNESIWGD